MRALVILSLMLAACAQPDAPVMASTANTANTAPKMAEFGKALKRVVIAAFEQCLEFDRPQAYMRTCFKDYMAREVPRLCNQYMRTLYLSYNQCSAKFNRLIADLIL